MDVSQDSRISVPLHFTNRKLQGHWLLHVGFGPSGAESTIRLAGEPALFHIKNKVQLIGYLGKNPEHKTIKKSGHTYALFSVATQSAWKDANEVWQRRVEWHRLIAWNGRGEYVAGKLKKGDHVYVEGMLVSSTYVKEVGKGKNKVKVPITAWQIKAQSIRKLNHVKKAHSAQPPVDAQPDEIPF